MKDSALNSPGGPLQLTDENKALLRELAKRVFPDYVRELKEQAAVNLVAKDMEKVDQVMGKKITPPTAHPAQYLKPVNALIQCYPPKPTVNALGGFGFSFDQRQRGLFGREI